MRIGLISDTHGKLRNEVFARFEGVDLILHAGDVGRPDILADLAAIAPVKAVYGNTDGFDVRSSCPEMVEVDEAGKRIVVVHGHLLGSPTPQNLRAAYPDAAVIVYGHTHKPLFDDSATPLVINPGAAGAARFHFKPSVAVLEVPSLQVQFFDIE